MLLFCVLLGNKCFPWSKTEVGKLQSWGQIWPIAGFFLFCFVLFVFFFVIKFYQNTVMPFCLHIVYGYFYITMAEVKVCSRDRMACQA